MRNFKKRRYIALGILLILFLINITVFFNSEKNRVELDPIEYSLPKMSDPDITIITPINKTYIEPMSGYFPGTYSFCNDEINSDPEDFITYEGGGLVDVINNYYGHKNIVQIWDSYTGDWAGISNNFDAGQATGTIEVYVSFSNTNKHHELSIRDGGSSDLIYLGFIDGYVWYNDGGGWISTGVTFSTTTWYRVKIEFNCTTDWHLWIDSGAGYVSIDGGTGYSFFGNPSEMDTLFFGTFVTDAWYYYYIDAIGYSWDENYKIGDNLHEGLLLSFENTTALDWMGYSLDGQANRTILGNYTIPMPEDGVHTIQMFGNDSVGTIHQSDVRHFSIFHIDIITPENKIYTDPMSGYYPATYGFENDIDGTSPEGWVNHDASSCHSQIISGLDGHNKVLRQIDNNNGLAAVLKRTFTLAQDHGTIEYFTRASVVTGGARKALFLYSTAGLEIWIVLGDSKINFWNGTMWEDIIPSGVTANTWYHFSVRWRSTGAPAYEGLAEGEWKIFIDEVEYGNYNLLQDDAMTSISIESGPAAWIYNVYWDAFGFDWENGYDIGDNLNEGLLLSFENSTTLDWMGYSLDGQANLTILGNSTIPMPESGFHSIQMFGNDSVGTIYQSDIQSFSVDTKPPEITITSPSQNQFFGNAAPNFDISIVEPNLNATWYTLDGGITNITSVGLTGTINQTEWNKIVADSVTIGFYANDSFGHEGYAEVVINKDLNPPQSSISHEGLTFTITADDGLGSGVAVIRYKINGSAWIDYIGPFSLDYGKYNITYYAIDAVGNVEGERTLIIDLREPPIEEEPPDTMMFIIAASIIGGIGLVIVITIIIIRKRK